MLTTVGTVLLLVALATAKQEDKKTLASVKDQESANDQVTSILVQPGPNGPRHVILSDDHQILSSDFSSRAVDSYHFPSNYPPRVENGEFHHTVPPPLRHVTYGPARPVTLRSRRPLYHHRLTKVPHLKATEEDSKRLSEAIYKYSTYIKHGKGKELSGDMLEQAYAGRDYEKPGYEKPGYEKPGYDKPEYEKPEYENSNYEKPDFSVTVPQRETYARKPQYEGLSAYREPHKSKHSDNEETKFRESIGDLYDAEELQKDNDYYEKKPGPPPATAPYSKLYFTKQHAYVPKIVDNKYRPINDYNPYNHNNFDGEYRDKPSGFDDTNGGRVVPILAKFYKQPLPVIQTQLPLDNKGLYFQLYQPQRADFERDEFSNNYFEPKEKNSHSLKRLHTSDSEWTPINAPDGTVPAKSYNIPAPDLSLGKPTSGKIFRRGLDSSTVVLGKSKQHISSNRHQHIQGNTEGVVSAVVRVKQ